MPELLQIFLHGFWWKIGELNEIDGQKNSLDPKDMWLLKFEKYSWNTWIISAKKIGFASQMSIGKNPQTID